MDEAADELTSAAALLETAAELVTEAMEEKADDVLELAGCEETLLVMEL